MSPSHVFEPTYEAIRSRLLAGAWPMGYRLEAGRLADDLGVSITPVRDSLNRLVGERLVALVPGIGFHVPYLTEKRLRDLLDLHLALLLHALDTGSTAVVVGTGGASGKDHAERSATIFAGIAANSGNEEITDVVQSVGGRLHAMRLRETAVVQDAIDELAALRRAVERGEDESGIRSRLRGYHCARTAKAPQLVRLLGEGWGGWA